MRLTEFIPEFELQEVYALNRKMQKFLYENHKSNFNGNYSLLDKNTIKKSVDMGHQYKHLVENLKKKYDSFVPPSEKRYFEKVIRDFVNFPNVVIEKLISLKPSLFDKTLVKFDSRGFNILLKSFDITLMSINYDFEKDEQSSSKTPFMSENILSNKLLFKEQAMSIQTADQLFEEVQKLTDSKYIMSLIISKDEIAIVKSLVVYSMNQIMNSLLKQSEQSSPLSDEVNIVIQNNGKRLLRFFDANNNSGETAVRQIVFEYYLKIAKGEK